MSYLTYTADVTDSVKPLVWLKGKVKSPPFTREARLEAGFYLRKLQQGETLSLPISRPMSAIGKRCHELRINDERKTWRIIYRMDDDAIIIGDVIAKKTKQTPKRVIDNCKRRYRQYDEDSGEDQ